MNQIEYKGRLKGSVSIPHGANSRADRSIQIQTLNRTPAPGGTELPAAPVTELFSASSDILETRVHETSSSALPRTIEHYITCSPPIWRRGRSVRWIPHLNPATFFRRFSFSLPFFFFSPRDLTPSIICTHACRRHLCWALPEAAALCPSPCE